MELSKKQLRNAYRNYVKRYNAKAETMRRNDLTMASDKMTYREYQMVRKQYVEEGQKININQTIVSDQQYEFSMRQARRLRETSKEWNLGFSEESIMAIRRGSNIRNEDLTLINNKMKELYSNNPEMFQQFATGTGRAKWIRENIYEYTE